LFHFDDNLRKALDQEMNLFVASIMQENRPLTDLLDANYTFLNERLAKHYGIRGVQGERFQRVTLPADSPRAGLLGKGALLMSTSYPNRPSPVIRGKWILENVFGSAPPPPPPNVPELKEERDPKKGAADARVDGGAPEESRLRELPRPDGSAGVCARELRCDWRVARLVLVGRQGGRLGPASRWAPSSTGRQSSTSCCGANSDQFLTTAIEKLLTYALGRGLEASDLPAVRAIKRGAATDNYRFASLIQQIVVSTPFTQRLSVSITN
jgi:hypothetical protein